MSTSLIRLAVGAAIALALTGAASAAGSALKPKASTTPELAGKCLAATTAFAAISEGDAKEGDDTSMTDLALTWVAFLKDKPDAYTTGALEQMQTTAETYTAAIKKSNDEGLAVLAGDMATCILEME